jgi:cob(I)alamin adenosyltransferase
MVRDLPCTNWPRGCVQVYTGDGKGKTTAALGLALRAAGAGLPVFIGQFCKARRAGEHVALERFADLITVRQYGTASFITGEPSDEDRALAQRGLAEAGEALGGGRYRVVILDEVDLATHFGLVSVEDVLALIAARPPQVELVLTGRRADPRVIAAADLVTEMVEVKHPYADGLPARKGIED